MTGLGRHRSAPQLVITPTTEVAVKIDLSRLIGEWSVRDANEAGFLDVGWVLFYGGDKRGCGDRTDAGHEKRAGLTFSRIRNTLAP
jgi:hypothetical protein